MSEYRMVARGGAPGGVQNEGGQMKKLASRAATAHRSRVPHGTHASLRAAARVRGEDQFIAVDTCTAYSRKSSPQGLHHLEKLLE